MKQLRTRWGRIPDRQNVWQEYPRPNFVRDSYLNLNGEWDYCISASADTPRYDGRILVPFSPEADLSGAGEILGPGQYLHYRKYFRLPDGFRKKRVLLHFGAVDQECRVSLNGVLLGVHKGGYLSFHFDVTDVLREENTLTLLVTDWTEKRPHARGKQKLLKKGMMSSIFYTPQSGIWQTVWMESVEDPYLEWVKITTLFDENAVRLRAKAVFACGETGVPERKVHVRISGQGQTVAEADILPGRDFVMALKEVHPWTPEDPYLYDVRLSFGKDQVSSYFGMRKVSVGRDGRGIPRFFLNNEPCFFNGLLDQGYWPEGLMTPPCDEALQYDIRMLKKLGYNTIGKHVKIEPERFYYHCDRLGMFVWQDMPNGGGDYDMLFVTYLPNLCERFARETPDHQYGRFRRADAEGRRQYYRDLNGMVRQLYNHPCIVAWTPFNEGWGQFDARAVSSKLRKLDQGRLINEACGWFDQKGGDMHSIHSYGRHLNMEPETERVLALTEYGGFAYPVSGHTACRRQFGYRHCATGEELTGCYRRFQEEKLFPCIEKGLSAAIYTQVSDIEEEINGIMTYDRSVLKPDPEVVRELNQRLYELFRDSVRLSFRA